MYDIECQLIKTLETLDKLLRNQKLYNIMEHVHKQQHESQVNTLSVCEEQFKNSSVSIINKA